MAEEPKIIVDEDWKAQAQREKEAAAAAAATQSTASTESSPRRPPLPPASFQTLLSTLASQALFSLGQIPHPETGQTAVDLDYARFTIDTVAVLQEKTKGNLSAEESNAIETLLHELRMICIRMK